MAMYEFISEHASLKLDAKCKAMLSMLEAFINMPDIIGLVIAK